MKTYKITVTSKTQPSLDYVDWYQGTSETHARNLHDEDCRRYQFPVKDFEVACVEVDAETLKPVAS